MQATHVRDSDAINRWLLAALAVLVLLMLTTHAAHASSSTGGGLPYEDWITKIKDSVTGPVALVISLFGFVGAGAALIFGGDMNGFLRTLILITLVLCFLVAAQNTLVAITGKGAEISALQTYIETRLA